MRVSKDQVINFLESRGAGDQLAQANAELPDQVDHEQHSGLLQPLRVDPQEPVPCGVRSLASG